MYDELLLNQLLGLSEVLLVLLSPTLNRRLDGVGCTRANLGSLVSVSELSLGLEAERDIPMLEVFSVARGFSVGASDIPEDPRVTELPALRRDVLHEPGASLTAGRVGSGFLTWFVVLLVVVVIGAALLRLLFKLLINSLFFCLF